MKEDYSKLIKSELIIFVSLSLVYILIYSLNTIAKGYILFVIINSLLVMISAKIYYLKYQNINNKSIFTISIFISLIISVIKDSLEIKDNYFIIFIIILAVFSFIFVFKDAFKLKNKI